jgi:ComF family protein
MQNSPIEKMFWGRIALAGVESILFFTKNSIVQKIIFEVKYKQNKKAGYLLGRLIANELINNPKYTAIDYLIPIPISKRKLRTRGFNQSLVICEAMIENGYKVPIFNGLTKTYHATTQTQKDRLQRAAKKELPFQLNAAHELTGKNILIIDDVLTTGATIEAACICLSAGNPLTIQIATAAYTL